MVGVQRASDFATLRAHLITSTTSSIQASSFVAVLACFASQLGLDKEELLTTHRRQLLAITLLVLLVLLPQVPDKIAWTKIDARLSAVS